MKLGCQKATVTVTAKPGTGTARAAPLRNTADVTFVVTPRMLSPTDVLYVRPSLQRTGIEPSTDQVCGRSSATAHARFRLSSTRSSSMR